MRWETYTTRRRESWWPQRISTATSHPAWIQRLSVFGNTTIGVVATNAKLTREEANKLASMAHDGLAMTIRPVHTSLDGDTFFAMSTGERECELLPVLVAGGRAVSAAILDAVRSAE